MSDIGIEVSIILLLVLANGVFALSEIAVVSARRARLQQRADEGNKGSAIAIELLGKPDDFLSTVQVGITLISTLAGAFGGARLAGKLAPALTTLPVIGAYAETAAMGLIVLAISYLSLILGELVPKRLALSNPERFAALLAPLMNRVSRIAAPAVRFLSWSAGIVMRILPFRKSPEPAVTEEEIKLLVKEGAEAGTFHEAEHEMVQGVFRLGDRRAVELMRPRHTIIWINLRSEPEEVQRIVAATPYTRLPVGDGTLDRIQGFVHVKDLLNLCIGGQQMDIQSILRPIPAVPESMPALKVLEVFRSSRTHIAAVINEHGGVEGLIALNDIMEAIVGELEAAGEGEDTGWARQREDGSWLIDGLMPIYELKELLGLRSLEGENEGTFTTLGGFVMATLNRIPETGDHFESQGRRYEVMDMDGNRVDRVLVSAAADQAPPARG
jgi:putative hemolysin